VKASAFGSLALAAWLLSDSAATLAAPGTPEDRCHQAIVLGMAGIKKGRVGQLSRCLKFGNYDDCVETDSHTVEHENDMRRRVAGESSSCQAAIDAGASVADFGPATCGKEYVGCDAEVPAVNSLDDVAGCLICHERGFDALIRDTLGWPRPFPDDPDERRCTRAIGRFTAHAVKKAIYETARCALGASKPFACPVDASPESRFGRALAVIERSVAGCGVDDGEAPGALANLCGGQASDQAQLSACFVGLAKCLACRGANSALDQSEDCAAFSGFAGCDGMF